MSEKAKRTQVAKIGVFITSIFIIFISVSYAFINQTLLGTKSQVITTGNLELKLTEENEIKLKNALPMYDEAGMIQDSFKFQLTNKTSNDTNYTLKLTDITSEGTPKLDTTYVKYGLEKNGEQTIELLSNLIDGVLDSGTLSGNETINYNLRLWIDSSVKDETLIKNKSLSYRIDVSAEQISYAGGMMEARGTEEGYVGGGGISIVGSTKKFYKYSDKITHIAIEKKINIPNTIAADKQWDVSDKQDRTVMAYLEENESVEGEEITYKLHIQANGKVYANPDCSYLFSDFFNIEQFDGLDNFDTSNVTNMSYMLSRYGSASLDLSYFNTSHVTDMSNMFSYYSSSQLLDLNSFNTSNVMNMSNMFSYYSSSAPLDLSHFDTSNVTNMFHMFSYYGSEAALDISSFDFFKVISYYGIFDRYNNYASPILVKDEAMRSWVLARNSKLTNVTVKEV